MSMHPFLYPLGTPERWLSYLTNWFKWSEVEIAIAKKLLDRNLIPLMKGSEIANFLGVSGSLVGHMVIKPNRYYRSYSIPKKSGKKRVISAPRIFLKTVQRYILDCILTPLPIHQAAVGFVRGRNMAMGAAVHVGKRFLWNIDLENFFTICETNAMIITAAITIVTAGARSPRKFSAVKGRKRGAP